MTSTIRLRFVTGDSWISKLIRAAEYGFWCSHVEAAMDDGTLIGAHIDGGVMARPANYDAKEWTRQLFVDLPCTPEQKLRFVIFVEAQIGKPYDTGGIGALALGRDWRENDSYFCSELIALALEKCGWFEQQLVADVAKVTPRDLLLVLSSHVPLGAVEINQGVNHV